MPALLDLPRELRDKILSLVIDNPAPAPVDALAKSDRTELHDVKYNGWYGGDGVKYSVLESRTDIQPILLVNHQLHAESLAALDLLPTKYCYSLDIMIVDECELWPTWLLVPALTTRVDKVYAAFRSSGISKGHHIGFSGGCGGPPMITWCFYSILERFLRVGAKGLQEKEHDELVSIKLLEVDVRTPDVAPDMLAPKDIYRVDKLHRLRKESGIDYLMHPEFIVNFIASEIKTLLVMGYHTAAFGGIVFERIGTIRLMLDGEVREEWDLAKLFSSIRFNDSFGHIQPRERRPEMFKKWKARAYKTRIELGLPVIPLEEGID